MADGAWQVRALTPGARKREKERKRKRTTVGGRDREDIDSRSTKASLRLKTEIGAKRLILHPTRRWAVSSKPEAVEPCNGRLKKSNGLEGFDGFHIEDIKCRTHLLERCGE